jgi:hypothetical protein
MSDTRPCEAAETASRALDYKALGHRVWREREADIREEFSDALWATKGAHLADCQHAIVFDRAWDDGHSEGYQRVEEEYVELVEFYGYIRKLEP